MDLKFFIDNISEIENYFKGLEYISANFLNDGCIFIIINTDTDTYFMHFLNSYRIRYTIVNTILIS